MKPEEDKDQEREVIVEKCIFSKAGIPEGEKPPLYRIPRITFLSGPKER